MSLKDFYELSFYEWVIYIESHKAKIDRLKAEYELQWTHTREIIAAIYNVNRDTKEHPNPFTGKDIKLLSFDKPDEKEKEDGVKQFKKLKAVMGTKFKK